MSARTRPTPHAVGVAVGGIVPQTRLPGDLAGGRRSVARDDLDGDTRLPATLHGGRNISAHRIGDRRHGRKMQSAAGHGFPACRRIGLGPRDAQRTHGTALESGQLRGHARFPAVVGAHGPHDLGRPLDTQHPPAGNTAADDGSHVFAFGREGEPVDNRGTRPQRFIRKTAFIQPCEQRPFGRIAENAPLGIEECGGIDRDDFGEIALGQRIIAHQLLHVHAVLRQRAGLVGADDRHGAHRLACVHPPHQVVGPEHAPHRHGERQGDAHGQPLGHGHDDDGHRNHEEVQDMLRNDEPVVMQQIAEKQRFAQQNAENDNGQSDADPADQARKTLQLTVERRRLLVRRRGLLGHAPGLGRRPQR